MIRNVGKYLVAPCAILVYS